MERPIPIQLFQLSSKPTIVPIPPTQVKGENDTFPFNLNGMEQFASAMQHNPEQANMPLIPKELISKIAEVTRVVAPEDVANIPKPEPHCNCPHCQIARAIHQIEDAPIQESEVAQFEAEEIVTEEELSFQQWNIAQTGDKLFCVTSRLDPKEHYNVFLGEPVGCTCGQPGCEHILAVLKT